MTTDESARASRPNGVAFLLAQTGAHAAGLFAERISALGVTPSDVGLLRMVAAAPGRSQRSLAEELGVVASRVVVLVDGLERRGLLERRRDPANRRNHALHLTAAGAEVMAGVRALRPAHEDEICAGLDDAQRLHLAELLGIIAGRQGLAPGVHPGYRAAPQRSSRDEGERGQGSPQLPRR
jgi:DNA-binding MarR family transcriptional regulator